MLEFIDRLLQPLSRKNSSSVKETTDFLDKVRKIHKIDHNECNGAYKMTHQTDSVNA